MPSSPPVVDDLVAEVAQRCAMVLADAGQFLDAAGGKTSVILQGLRRGFKAVGHTPADALVLADSDVATASTYALERVLDEAELFSLQRAQLHWYRALQKETEALSSNVVASGWRVEERNGLMRRISELKGECERAYREPSDPVVVARSDPRECRPWGVWRPGFVDDCGPFWPGGFP